VSNAWKTKDMTEEKKEFGAIPPQETQKASSAEPAANSATQTAAPADANQKPDLSKEAYDKSYKPEPWSATPQGRLAIRTFSRGVMGAMFFTAGGLWARRFMFGHTEGGVNQSLHSWETRYNPTKTFGQIIEEKNPFQFVAKTIDTFIGTPIEKTVNLFHGDGVRAVHFRPTQYKYMHPEKGEYFGRSLGFETMMVTFDFFCASIGDALGRDMAGWIDPGVKQSWTDDKGNIKWPETVKAMTNSAFRYVTYNGGEDWAVAIPYVYFMKMQRNWLDKKSPGFGIDSDAGLNGGGSKIRQFGQDPHYNVVGSYNLEGIFDLQTRFTVYNMGTLLYRELYDKVEKAWNGKHVNLYGDPLAAPDPNKSFIDKTVDVGKWMIRGMVKGFINMTPATPFFWITRGMQSKHRAMFIDPDQNAVISFRDGRGRGHYLYANDSGNPMTQAEGYSNQSPVHFAQFDPAANHGNGAVIEHPSMPPEIGNPSARSEWVPKGGAYRKRHNVMENAFSSIGSAGHEFSMKLDPVANALENLPGFLKRPLKGMLGLRASKDEKFTRFTKPYINAAVSYTPYMYMKTETANLWDHGKMDLALERTIDGLFQGNWDEIQSGAGEVGNALLHKPLLDPEREKLAQYRVKADSSASDSFTQEDAAISQGHMLKSQAAYDLSAEASKAAHAPFAEAIDKIAKENNIKPKSAVDIPWQERVIKGREGLEAGQTVSTRHAPQAHADREEMRKLLEEVSSPSNSVH